MEYNLGEIRKLISSACDDDALQNLCFDHFRPVYDHFTTGQMKGERIRKLVEHANRQREIPKLLGAIEEINPNAYTDFKLCLDLDNIFDLEQIKADSIDELTERIREHQSEKIQCLYGKIRLLNQKQIEVNRLYVDVYILERLSKSNYTSINNLLKLHNLEKDRLALGKQLKRLPGLDVANKYNRLMVLGKPGSGKTTFLRHLAIACCKGEFQPARIPVLIELRRISNFKQFNLTKLIQQELQLRHESQTIQILNDGKILLLLDGLDEVVDQSRKAVQRHIQQFSADYYKNWMVVTCRTQVTKYDLNQFEYVEVADFNLEQVLLFAYNWFTVLAETFEQGEALSKAFIQKLRQLENKQTAELCVTPVLLSLACWVFQDLQDFPQERTDLYRRGIELLLEQWDESRGIQREFSNSVYRNLSTESKQKLLGDIAVRKFQQEQFALFEQNEIQEYIAKHLNISNVESREVLKSVEAQHGLLIERASQIYSFSHLTFQEYFAARWLCDHTNWQGIESEILQQRWKETLSIAFMMPNASQLAQTIKAEIDHLLASDLKLQQFLAWLKTKVLLIETPFKPAAVRAFYFALALNLDINLVLILEPIFTLSLDSTLFLDRILDLNKNDVSTLAHINYKLSTYNSDSELDPNLNLDFAFNLALHRVCTHNLDFVRAIDFALKFGSALNIKHASRSDLCIKLQALQEQLPSKSREILRWHKTKGKAWIEQFRELLLQYRDIGHDWQFSDIQKQRLQQYYEANSFLMHCLKESKVSLEVKQEIEEMLLLPIAEIEKQKRNKLTGEANS